MPHPVQSSSGSPVLSAGYYDMEGGQCIDAEPPAPPMCAKPQTPPAVCASGAGPSQAAVDRLVQSQVEKAEPESCTMKVIGATIDCAKAALSVAAAESVVGAANAALNVADCGLGAVAAYRCLTQ